MSLALLIAAAFLLTHPYTGIRHDGTLYMGEALARILPGEFHDDLYFLFGSQGRFSLMPELYGQLIAAFGLGNGTLVGMLIAFALYCGASAFLIAWVAPPSLRIACVLSVLLGWSIYGGQRIFAYGEPFLTARSFAEPAVLLALGLLVRGRVALAGLALGLALVIHPLIALGGVLAAWTLLVMRDRRWIVPAVVAALVFVLLAVIGAGPFSDVFSRYEEPWLTFVREANVQAFVLLWMPRDFGILVFNLTALGFAAVLAERRAVRDLVVAATIVGLGTTFASVLLVDLALNPFVGKLQIWRGLWVMQWMTMATLPIVATGLWKRGDPGRLAAVFLTIGWIAPFSVAPGWLAAMALLVYRFRARIAITTFTVRLVMVVGVLVAITIVAQSESRVFGMIPLLHPPIAQVIGQTLAVTVVALALVGLAIRFLPGLGWAGPALGAVFFLVALALWDERGAWPRRLESYPLGTHIWPGLIEPGAKVYWYRELIAPWVLLGHGNYYAEQQGSGAVFSRDLVGELIRRQKVTALLDFQEQICRLMNNVSEKQSSCEPEAEAVRTVCVDGGIDYVVLQSNLEGAKPLADFSTGVVENGYEKKFFLYRCSMLEKR